MAISATDIDKITKKYLTIADTGNYDFTVSQVTDYISQVVKSEVFPVFRTAGYQVASTYPSTSFSSDTDENAEIDWFIAHLVAYRLAERLPRFTKAMPEAINGWKRLVLGSKVRGEEEEVGWLDKVRSGEIKYAYVTRETSRAATNTPLVSDTTLLFGDSDNAEGDESNVSNWED